MIRTVAGFALLLSSSTLIGQTSAPSPFGTAEPQSSTSPSSQEHSSPGSTVTIYPAAVAGCPIGMRASQSLWDRTVKVRDGEKQRVPQKFGQRISLNLSDPHPARIVSATVRVRGLNGKNRALPTPADTAQPWNAVRTLRVNFAEERDGTVSADLWLGGFTSVGSIQLIDVSYSDGSAWRISESSACRVQPDPVMLITER